MVNSRRPKGAMPCGGTVKNKFGICLVGFLKENVANRLAPGYIPMNMKDSKFLFV